MKVNIHIFNVRHGDSIVIELIHNNKSYWIIVDCNMYRKNGALYNPSFEFLKSRNVSEIDTVILTHLHADHYMGMDEILNNFKIKKFLIPPFLSSSSEIFNKQIKMIMAKIEDLAKRTSDSDLGKKALSLANIIKFLRENEDKIFEGKGPWSSFFIDGIPEPIGTVYLPLAKIKGHLIQIIETGNFELDSFKHMNDASVTFVLNVGKESFIFGADSTNSQWLEHMRQMKIQAGKTALKGTMLKVPHHGSKHNNNKKIYNYILDTSLGNHVFVSSNGQSHPHDEFFELVNEFNLKPYCTSLARQCMGENVFPLGGLGQLPNQFKVFIASYKVEDLPIPCQGDITISIDGPTGTVETFNSTGITCPYRALDSTNLKVLLS